MITKDELLKDRDKTFAPEYTEQISDNLDSLLVAINAVRKAYNKPMTVTSAWRPASINGMVKGAAPKSNHIIGLAVDIHDPDGGLMRWVLDNLQLMTDLGLYMEDFRWTGNWCHFQLCKPASGKRIFVPAKGLAPHPERWDGRYPSKFDGKAVK